MESHKSLLKSRIKSIVRICDLIKIDFESNTKTLCLHVQTALLRIIESGELRVSSSDMYLPGNAFKKKLFNKFKWDESGSTLYDDEIKTIEKKLINSVISNVVVGNKDLLLYFENALVIEILADTLQENHEVYRFFEKNNLDSHFVVET